MQNYLGLDWLVIFGLHVAFHVMKQLLLVLGGLALLKLVLLWWRLENVCDVYLLKDFPHGAWTVVYEVFEQDAFYVL